MEPIAVLSYAEKIPLYDHTSYRKTHSISNFMLFEQNVATLIHFVVAYKVIFILSAYQRSMLVVA